MLVDIVLSLTPQALDRIAQGRLDSFVSYRRPGDKKRRDNSQNKDIRPDGDPVDKVL